MIIQVNSDNHITGTQEMIDRFSEEVKSTLKRFENQITRIEVHLADENKGKKGVDDKKCTIEARGNGLSPEAVSFKSDTIDESFVGALGKMKHLLSNKLDQHKDHHKI
ncbi:MAG TPA: hypothetical protein PK076_06660 [Saprospiraceae bacterium]|nr:hypothetical protein [Saprospiraceae bacterium]HQW55789.1 hypothetical protein [Saprospiraceae bacterium]